MEKKKEMNTWGKIPTIALSSAKRAFVTFNNQSSVLLTMEVTEENMVCLLHDNRIFAFEKDFRSIDNDSDASSSSKEQNLILNLLTTPKFRAMSFMYIFFRLLDNISLLAIIVLSIIKGKLITDPSPATLALLSTLGLELFYDVMLQTSKYWILERLSIYIGIVLYGVYGAIIKAKQINGDLKGDDLWTVVGILLIKLGSFLLEEFVDIAIDGQLHNELLRLDHDKVGLLKLYKDAEKQVTVDKTEEKKPDAYIVPLDDGTQLGKTSLLQRESPKLSGIWKYMTEVKTTMAPDIKYRGSFFAWSVRSVFNKNVWGTTRFPNWLSVLLCAIPGFVTGFLLLALIAICCIAAFIPVCVTWLVLAICCCTCNPCILKKKLMYSNFWKELTRF